VSNAAQDVQAAHAPRQVLLIEVAACAKTGCSRCHGAGYITRIHHANREDKTGGEVRTTDACRCAVKRFKKKHADDVMIVNGAPMWAPGKAPELKTAA